MGTLEGLQTFETCFARLAFDLAVSSNSSDAMSALLAAQRATLMEPVAPLLQVVAFPDADAPILEIQSVPGLEVPRRIAPAISEFLVESIRNWAAHGRESRAERKFAGKLETAKVLVSVSLSTLGIKLEFHDDGAGIQTKKVIAAIREKKLMTAEDLSKLELGVQRGEDSQLYSALFLDQLTTRETPGVDAGRGMGLSRLKSLSQEFGARISASRSKILGGFMISLDLPCSLLTCQVLRKTPQLLQPVSSSRHGEPGLGAAEYRLFYRIPPEARVWSAQTFGVRDVYWMSLESGMGVGAEFKPLGLQLDSASI
ncbi:MAG: hypothetical protein KGQ59_00705 [Bdellovibrionales bacterium]|nr:hypothetical protein [Bdellovibrionales bacterium]